MDLKSTINESFEEFKDRFEVAKKKVCEKEDSSSEITQSEEQKNKIRE